MWPTWSERDSRSWRWPWWAPLPVGWWTLLLQESTELTSWLPLPLGPHPPVSGGNGLPLLWGKLQREPIKLLLPWCQHPQRRMSQCHRWCLFPKVPLRPKLAAWEAPCSPQVCPRDQQFLATLPTYDFLLRPSSGSTWRTPARFTCVGRVKTSFNQDSMVSHYLKEHLRVHLVCPECRMSCLDPLNFQYHGTEIHNLLFY